jgi:hypothetical protein
MPSSTEGMLEISFVKVVLKWGSSCTPTHPSWPPEKLICFPPSHSLPITDDQVFAEHRSLFRSPLSSVTTTRRVVRRHHPYQRASRPVPTWSHKFFCLCNVNTTRIAMSKGFKDTLASFGLGEKVVSLRSDATPEHLHSVLIRTYPLLQSCGGYTILKCEGTTKLLQVIDAPPGGHSPLSLSSIGQSRIYIRPLQRDIVLTQNRLGKVSLIF